MFILGKPGENPALCRNGNLRQMSGSVRLLNKQQTPEQEFNIDTIYIIIIYRLLVERFFVFQLC